MCQNTVGSYKCVCKGGFAGDGKSSCISLGKYHSSVHQHLFLNLMFRELINTILKVKRGKENRFIHSSRFVSLTLPIWTMNFCSEFLRFFVFHWRSYHVSTDSITPLFDIYCTHNLEFTDSLWRRASSRKHILKISFWWLICWSSQLILCPFSHRRSTTFCSETLRP